MLEAQHLLIDWFAGYGVQVQGASDHLWLANMAANSEVENGTAPLGFYVHTTGSTPTDIHLYNTDANMNYAGYEFAGCGQDCPAHACAFEIKNCRAYGNRAYGIVDNAQGAVSYDYCHLYANNLATALTVDTSGTPGPTAGTNNRPAEEAPWVREWRRWPAYTTVSYDDPGLMQYSDTYVSSLLPIMASRHVPLSIAVVTGGSYSQSIVEKCRDGSMRDGISMRIRSRMSTGIRRRRTAATIRIRRSMRLWLRRFPVTQSRGCNTRARWRVRCR